MISLSHMTNQRCNTTLSTALQERDLARFVMTIKLTLMCSTSNLDVNDVIYVITCYATYHRNEMTFL